MVIAKRPPPDLFKLATNAWTQPFWDAAAQHRLVVAQCRPCGTCRMPPTPFCPACQSQQIDWKTLTGLGEIYAYTIVDRAILPGMADHLPYVPAVITLEGGGGVRLISNVVDVELAELAIGMPVQVVWDDLREGVAVPRFSPRIA
ncbi:MAG: hypothetical protein RIS90_2575 [Pseudomonadota bacterium]|jgi:uncharacterized OB-fold protein